jgi:hypothetical protein
MNTKKFIVAVVFSLFAVFFVGHAPAAHASSTDNVFGEAWSDNIGWISFNNCTSATACSGSNYGVSVDPTTGNMSGEAWSSAVGWLSFNETSGCPVSGCTTQPKINLSTGAITGFAKAVSTADSGWSGWIDLGSTGNNDGWQMNTGSGAVTGAAWGDLNVGWLVPSADMKVVLTPPSYTITACSPSNGAISPSGATSVASGSSKAYTITPSNGYSTASLTVDGSSKTVASSYTFSNVTANHSICATFAINTYTITASSGSGGSVTPTGTTTVNSGSSKTYTITPNSGYYTASVTVDGSSQPVTSSYTFSNVTANHTISATFFSSSDTITACSPSNGTVSPSGATSVASGSSKTYTITPSPGYTTATMTVDGSSTAPVGSYTFPNILVSHSICAVFTTSPVGGPYTITSSSGPNGKVTPVGASSVSSGGSKSYNITPDAGYSVASLIIDGKGATPATTYTFTNVTSDHTIYASFIDTSKTVCSGSQCAPGNTFYQCSDGIDNDGDGLIDYPQDPGCSSATDNSENNLNVTYTEN